MAERFYDAIVLGAGPAGEVCAERLAGGGMRVAIVEPHLLGGECSYYACMPSKALLRPAEALAEAERLPGLPLAAGRGLDPGAVLSRRDEVIHGLDDSSHVRWLDKRGIELRRGAGRLDGERRVLVDGDALNASRAVVAATGSAAAMPPIEGLDAVEPWNNREGTTAGAVPPSLLVLGGGPVGCELAQAWASLGSRVALVEAAERLLPAEEPFAGEQLAAALRERFGVDVRTGAQLRRVEPGGAGVRAQLGDDATVEAAELLVAVGRRPRTAGLGLNSAGVEPDGDGFLRTDDRLRVGGRDWLYAIGDVNGRALLTHCGKYQAWVAAENLLGRPVETTAEALGPPRVTFTDPQVAAVGRTLTQAREDGVDAVAVDARTDGSAGASFHGAGSGGTSRLVVDRGRGALVGATFTGFQTAELVQAATVALAGAVPLARLRHALAPFPTRSEVWLELLERWEAA